MTTPKREQITIEFKRERPRDHAADASAVASGMDALATLVKDLRQEYAQDQEFLVNARPFRKGSLVVVLEIVLFSPDSLLAEPPFFELIRRHLRSFVDLRIRIGSGEFSVEDGNIVITDGQRIAVDRAVLEMIRPNSKKARLFQHAFERAEADPGITAVEYRSNRTTEPIAIVPRQLFRRFHTPIPEESLLAPRERTTRERLVIRSVAFDPGLAWHFVWDRRPITALVEDTEFMTRVGDRQEAFRNGDRLVVDLTRHQEYDTTARTHIDKRFMIRRVIERIQADEAGRLFTQ